MLKLFHYQLVFLSKIKIRLIYLQQFKEEEVTEPRPASTIKEETPTRVMLRDLTILNTGYSRNQRIRLLEMANIGIGAPSTV